MSYYPNPPGQYRPEPVGLSVASLVLGIVSILGLCFTILVPLAGIITGHLGYRREPRSRALSLTGLITSWLGLLIAVAFYGFIIWLIWIAADAHQSYGFA